MIRDHPHPFQSPQPFRRKTLEGCVNKVNDPRHHLTITRSLAHVRELFPLLQVSPSMTHSPDIRVLRDSRITSTTHGDGMLEYSLTRAPFPLWCCETRHASSSTFACDSRAKSPHSSLPPQAIHEIEEAGIEEACCSDLLMNQSPAPEPSDAEASGTLETLMGSASSHHQRHSSLPLPSKDEPLRFSFACGGWLKYYLFGVAKAIKDHGLHKDAYFIGCSAGKSFNFQLDGIDWSPPISRKIQSRHEGLYILT